MASETYDQNLMGPGTWSSLAGHRLLALVARRLLGRTGIEALQILVGIHPMHVV